MLRKSTIEGEVISESYSYLKIVFQRLKKHRLAIVAFWTLFLLIIVVIFAKLFSFGNNPFSYVTSVSWASAPEFAPPGPGHILGLDEMGRDVWSRLLYGGRVSLYVGLSSSIFGSIIGLLVGLLSGFLGGITDSILMRFTDMMLSIPVLPFLLVLSSLLKGSINLIVLIIVIFSWMGVARLVRGQVLSLNGQEFVEAARAIGNSPVRIMFVHLLPNTLSPAIVATTLSVGGNIIYEATLSFLGLGVRDPMPSWGNMLSNSQNYILSAPWLVLWPGLAILITTLSFNFLGDGLRDALDPRLYR
jgi:peptide/nickel transport system permease protein